MQRVEARVRQHGTHAGLFRVVAPAHPGIVRVGRVGVRPVRELRYDDADAAEIPRGDHGARLPHHGISRVPVIDGQDPPVGPGRRHEGLGVLESGRERFLAQDVETCFQAGLRDFVVRGVRRRHGYKVEPLGAR